MKRRVVFAVLLGNAAALLLVAVAVFVTVHFTDFGRLVTDVPTSSPTQLAARYGDPFMILQRTMAVLTWLVLPLISLLTGVIAGIVCGRTIWWVAPLSIIGLIVLVSGGGPSIRFFGPVVYTLVSWLGMKIERAFAARPPATATGNLAPEKGAGNA